MTIPTRCTRESPCIYRTGQRDCRILTDTKSNRKGGECAFRKTRIDRLPEIMIQEKEQRKTE